MTNSSNYHTRNIDEELTCAPTLYDRYQADYDYNGSLQPDEDVADCYRMMKAVRLG